jgi:hypothetical protein
LAPFRLGWVVGALLASGLGAGNAQGAPLVKLRAGFNPNRLGVPTTIKFGLNVSVSQGHAVPPPLTELKLSLPAGMGLASSTLGLAECEPSRLLAQGPAGCPANSRVGQGAAVGLIESEGEAVQEAARVTALLGPPIGETEQVLFYAEALSPVVAELVFSGLVVPSEAKGFGGQIVTTIPLVPAWTAGPDVSITSFSSSIGPAGLTYLRRVRGEYVPYKPRGIGVPTRCPRGGFPFSARLAFADGSHASANTSVPCPRGSDGNSA